MSKLHPPSARNLGRTKTAFSEFFFPKNAINVSVTSSCAQKMTQFNESNKNEKVQRYENVFQFL